MAGITAAFLYIGFNSPEMVDSDLELYDIIGDSPSWIVMTFQLLSMGFLSPLSLGVEINAFGGFAGGGTLFLDRKSTRLNSSHVAISYAVFCLKKKHGYIHMKPRWY